ncbi:MAG TPA: hypothetical protein PLE37_13530, partial [Pseudomonadota bacterium]|nr:hypothetical protein [Pseudomonadota bacterium]
MKTPASSRLPHVATDFADRHIGPSPQEIDEMLHAVGATSLDALIRETVPDSIRQARPLSTGAAVSEVDALARLRALADRNQACTSLIGQG